MQHRRMLDHSCIVRWITFAAAKDVGHEGRADAELMRRRVVPWTVVVGLFS